jgi:hypothetical protein
LGVGLTTPPCTTFLVENPQITLAGEEIRRRTSKHNGLKSKCKQLENESTRQIGVEKHRWDGLGLTKLWYLRKRRRSLKFEVAGSSETSVNFCQTNGVTSQMAIAAMRTSNLPPVVPYF